MNKKTVKFLGLILVIVLFLMFGRFAFATDTVNITLKVYSGDTALFNGPETVTACAESPANDALVTLNGKCAIEQSLLSNTWTWNYAPSGWLDELGGYTTTPDYSKSWGWFNDLNYGSVALNQHILSDGEELLLTYNSFPLRISASTASGIVGDTIIFTAEEESTFDANYNMLWTPSSGTTATLGTQSCITIADGTCSIVLETAGSLNAVGSKTLYVPSASVNVEVSTPKPIGGSASCCSVIPPSLPIIKAEFDLKKAFDFLIAQQKENGSFGEDIYTDWTALALASGNYQDQTIKLIKYFGESKLENPTLTDYERRAMALMSLGLNPYDIYPASSGTNNENYIEKIITSFDGKQFGNINEDNDDIFALIVLQNAGYTQDEKMISDDISFILSRQKENGSWDESVDMTGAGIEALSAFNQNEQIKNAFVKAKEFLKQNQKENGGWNNASSTAWAIEGILAMNEKPANIAIGDTPEYFDLQNIFREDWIKNGNTPLNYLATIQDTDGGIKNLPAGLEGENLQNKIWETAYVASALSGKTWNQIMQKFEKPNEEITKEKENRLLEEKLEKILALLEEKKTEEEKILKSAVVKITAKKPAQSIENAKNPKKSEKEDETLKLENLTSQNISQNTATALTAITDSPAQKTEAPKRNWFLRFLDKIFSIF